MKKLLALLLCLMMVLPAFALAEGNKVLTVATWDATTTPYLIATKEAYEASHPGVTIEYVDVASQDYYTKTSSMLAAGDTIDVFDVKELSDLQNWIQQGFVVNLDDYIKTNNYALAPYVGMEKSYADAEGSIYALPYRSDFWVLFYNKTLFDAAGVAYPTNDMTWDEYADLARKMTSGEGIDKIYGSHYHTWLSCVANWAVCDGVNTLADGEYSDLVYFYELYQALEDEGVIMEYPELRAAGLHYRGAFEQGNIAMLPMGYWFVATLIGDRNNGDFDFDWSFVAVPHQDHVAAGSSFGSPTGACINKNSTQQDLAWDFISWRCSEEGAKVFASVGARPAYVSPGVAEVMASVEGFPKDEAALAALLPSAVSLEWPTGEFVNEIKTIVNEVHTSIMVREVEIEDGVKDMIDRVAELFK